MFDIKLPGGINAVASANGSLFYPSNMAKSSGTTWPRSLARGRTAKSTGTSSSLLDFGLIDCTRPSIKQSGRFQAMLCAPMQPTSSRIVFVLIPQRLPAAGPADALNPNKKQRNSTVIVTSN
jgi:hypothetical protein